jgi:hypothetical protein
MTAILDRPDHTASRAAPSPVRRSRLKPGLLLGAGVVAALLAVAQLVLPSLASNRVRDRLEKAGTVESVQVSAFPAVKLLWGQADEVKVRMATADFSPAATGGSGGSLNDALAQTRAAQRLDVSVGTLTAGPVKLHDALLEKRGSELHAHASISEADLERGQPSGLEFRPSATSGGQLVFTGRVRVLGFEAKGRARLLARDGGLVIRPQGPALAAAPALTVFEDENLDIRSVHAEDQAGGFTVHARAVER